MNGTPTWTRTTVKRPAHERFWEKVIVAGRDECWMWTGALRPDGYGTFWDGQRKIRAHRFLLTDIPDGAVVDHTCHNGSGCAGGSQCQHRACVNPFHMEFVSIVENLERGNAFHGRPKLTTECVRGHALTPENSIYSPEGHRRCLTCRRAAGLRHYHRTKGDKPFSISNRDACIRCGATRGDVRRKRLACPDGTRGQHQYKEKQK